MPPRRRVCRVLDAPPAQTLWRRRACARIPPLESVSRASSTHTEQMDEVTAADAEAGGGRRRPSRKRAANLPTSPPTRPALLYLNKLFARECRDLSHRRSCRRCRHCAGPARLGRDRAVARRMSCCLCRFNLTATVLKNEHEFLAWAMARACLPYRVAAGRRRASDGVILAGSTRLGGGQTNTRDSCRRDGPSRATLSILLGLRSRRRRVMLRVMLVGALVSTVNGATLELHADNFDDTMEKHDEVLVHFHAPCAQPCQSRTRLPEQPHASSSAS